MTHQDSAWLDRLRQTAFDEAPDGVLIVDQGGIIVAANARIAALLGYSNDALVGAHIDTLVPTSVRAGHSSHVRGFFAKPSIREMSIARDLNAQRADGTLVPVDVRLSGLTDGDTVYALAYVRDVSEARALEQEFRAVFEEAPDGILIVDSSGCITTANPAIERMLGYPSGSIPGNHIDTLVPSRWRDGHSAHVATFFDSPSVRSMVGVRGTVERNLHARRHDGSEMPVYVRLGHYEVSGKKYAIAHVFDVTERRALEDEVREAREAAEQALRQLVATHEELLRSERHSSIGRLVAGISHEINTPVGVALTGSSHLVESAREVVAQMKAGTLRRSELMRFLETAQQTSDVIAQNLHRASELIGSFKKVAVDRSAADVQTVDLHLLIEDVVRSLAPFLKRTAHRVDVLESCRVTICTEPGALTQILTNLIQNAVIHAFPDDQAGVITVSASQDERSVHLVVADDGVGMTPEVRDAVFQAFFTTRRGSGGSGLGLHIVERLVHDQLDGSVSLTSTLGEGSAFHIQLPSTGPRAPEAS